MSQDKTAEQLRECPFCGYHSRIMAPKKSTISQRDSGYGRYQYGVECQADLACAARVYGFPDQASANKAWNTRADSGEAVGVLNLQCFVGQMFEAADWPDGGDVDGFEFQRIATDCGLLAEVEMKEPCGEICQCLEMDSDFPATCYRPTQLYRDCKAAIASREGEGK